MSMLFKRIKDWATSITAFRTGDVIPVDGPDGTAKMGKDDLLKETKAYSGIVQFEELDRLYNAVTDNVELQLNSKVVETGVQVGDTFTPSYESQGGYKAIICDIAEGDVIYIQGSTGGSANVKLYAFLDEDDVVLEIADTSFTALTDTKIVAPAGAVKFVFQSASLFNPYVQIRRKCSDTILENLAPAFDPTRTSGTAYKSDEAVTYEGKLYCFKASHYGAWDASNVREVNLDDYFKLVKALGTSVESINRINLAFSNVTGTAPNKTCTISVGSNATILFDKGFTTLSSGTIFNGAPYNYGSLCAIINVFSNALKRFECFGNAGSSINRPNVVFGEVAIPVAKWDGGELTYSCNKRQLFSESIENIFEKGDALCSTELAISFSDVTGTMPQEKGTLKIEKGGTIVFWRDFTSLSAGTTFSDAPYSYGALFAIVNYKTKTFVQFRACGIAGSNINPLALDDGQYAVPVLKWLRGKITWSCYDAGVEAFRQVGGKTFTTYKTIYVATTGDDTTGDGTSSHPYATIYKANSVITDNSEYNRYIVKVADGTYTDLQTRYAGSADPNLQGVICKPWVSYVGNTKNPENVVIEWDGSTGYAEGVFNYNTYGIKKCAFHITMASINDVGERRVAGFNIKAKNTRYAIHVEANGFGMGFHWSIEDCIFEWDGVPADPSAITPAAIGTGSGHFEKGKVARCKIINTASPNKAFRNHDSAYKYSNDIFREGADITLESVDCGGGEVVFRDLYQDNNCDGYNRCNIINCTNISDFTYTYSSPVTEIDWRAQVKCSNIVNNVFQTNGKMQ